MKKINSLSEYLEFLSSLKQISLMTSTVGCFTLFRGQANATWGLSPSLYRQNLFRAESLLLTEIKHICPQEIPENRFDALVKMQHFGMPTRMLDVTTNPLVALYFACKNDTEKDQDGAVYIFTNVPVSWSTDPLVELIMDFAFDYNNQEKVWLDQFLDRAKKKYSDAIHRLMPDDINSLLHYLTIPAFAVMPAKTNERIEAQDGAFFILGMKLRKREVSTNIGTLGRVYYYFDPVDIEQSEKIWHNAETIVIPASAKNSILKQLDLVGVNEKKLFPDLSHQISYTVDSVRRQMLQ